MLDKGIMYDYYCLWESIHYFGYSRGYVSVVHLVLEIVFIYEFLCYHGYMDYYILFSIHAII